MYEYLNVTYTPPPLPSTSDRKRLQKVKASKVVYSNKNLKKKLLIYKKINNADFWIPTNVRLEMLIGLHLLSVEPVNVRTSAPGENVQNIWRTSVSRDSMTLTDPPPRCTSCSCGHFVRDFCELGYLNLM